MRAGVIIIASGLAACFSKPELVLRDAAPIDGVTTTDAAACAMFRAWGAPALLMGANDANSDDESPAISPDGTLVVWARRATAGDRDLYVGRFDGAVVTDARKIVILGSAADETSPAWSHDGSKLYFSRGLEVLASDVVTGDPTFAAAGPDSLIADLTLGPISHPRFTANGTEVYFVRDGASNNPEIFRARRASTAVAWPAGDLVSELSTPLSSTYGVAISPDGLTIYFTSDRASGGSYEVFTATHSALTGSFENAAVIPDIGQSQRELDVSRDGTTMLFWKPAPTKADIFIARRDCL